MPNTPLIIFTIIFAAIVFEALLISMRLEE